jgi:hypothetical protein
MKGCYHPITVTYTFIVALNILSLKFILSKIGHRKVLYQNMFDVVALGMTGEDFDIFYNLTKFENELKIYYLMTS